MNILLIGGTGFLGSHLVRRLIDRRHEVTIISRTTICTNELAKRLACLDKK